MKLIIAIIKPFKLDEVRAKLAKVGVQGMTISDVKGFGRQRGQPEFYRGAEYTANLVPKTKLEIAVRADLVAPVVEAIRHSAATGKIGDGKLFVVDLEHALRIRTGEADELAL